MDRTAVKTYAPQARREFIEAVTSRAAHFGLTADGIEPMTRKGDGVVIGGRVFPAAVAEQRKALEDRIRTEKVPPLSDADAFHHTMEKLAYTWFNRLVAVRYMELHDYLENGPGGASFRVLSHPDGKPTPEILERADEVELPGLKREHVIGLKLDGKEGELYRLLLVTQCNALHAAMPFLFEKVADETELVLPENLLNTDSLVRKLVAGIPEADWREEVEIIGWLYESYNSERYAEVIGSVVACDDIPVATQKFTPKWVVQYLVQNTVGRLWLSTYPDSPLKATLGYYVEPAEQTEDVRRQLAELTPTSLNPEEITMLEPACGSGHILAVGYDVFKAIYLERGYRLRDIPALILRKNLVGLEIDKRAEELAAFTLMMKARADDHRFFTRGVQPCVVAILPTRQCRFADSTAQEIADALNAPVTEVELPPSGRLFDTDEDTLFTKKNLGVAGDIAVVDVDSLQKLFENANCTGSMIRVPDGLAGRLPAIEARVRLVATKGDPFTDRPTAGKFLRLVEQARLLARRYKCVVANPPYMNSDKYEPDLKRFVSKEYQVSGPDLCTSFMERGLQSVPRSGFVGMVTMQSWMFQSDFMRFRERTLSEQTIESLAHLGSHAFPSIGGQRVQVAMFAIRGSTTAGHRGVYMNLTQGDSAAKDKEFHNTTRYIAEASGFSAIPGSPMAYWATVADCEAYRRGIPLADLAAVCNGIKTGSVELFTKLWHEVSISSIGFGFSSQSDAEESRYTWFPYCKSFEYRKWAGGCSHILR